MNSNELTEKLYSVSGLAAELRQRIEDAYPHSIAVEGELSNCMVASSGHFYCRLKDEGAVLDAVCWRGVFKELAVAPQDGMKVICHGRLATYSGRSTYQLVIKSFIEKGEGELHRLFLRLRKRLASEGLFDEARKKPLPFLPQVVGVVTSEQGAVLHDIAVRLRARFGVRLVLFPAKVQGEGALRELIEAVKSAEQFKPDVLIMARGGGSLEDLWSFNEEELVRVLHACPIPIVSAVGHETDITLCDDVADRRAPTPTAAADIVVPDKRELRKNCHERTRRLTHAMMHVILARDEKWSFTKKRLIHPRGILEMATQRLDVGMGRLKNALRVKGQSLRERLASLRARLNVTRAELMMARAHEDYSLLATRLPLAQRKFIALLEDKTKAQNRLLYVHSYKETLKRGYAVVRQDDHVVMREEYLARGRDAEIEFFDGRAHVQTHDKKDEKDKSEDE